MSTVYILKAKVNGQEAIIGVSDVGAIHATGSGATSEVMDQLRKAGYVIHSVVAVPGLLVLGEPPAREAGGAGYDFGNDTTSLPPIVSSPAKSKK